VVHAVEDQTLHDGVECAQIRRHAGDGIELPSHGHLDQVVVSVLAVALAVDPRVVLGREGWVLEPVPRAEVVLPRQLDRAHAPKYST